MKIKGYKEINFEEYDKIPDDEGIFIYNNYEKKHYYFKKAQKFPIVFEDEFRKIEVYEEIFIIKNKMRREEIHFRYDASFPLLVEAMIKSIESARKIIK